MNFYLFSDGNFMLACKEQMTVPRVPDTVQILFTVLQVTATRLPNLFSFLNHLQSQAFAVQ